MTDVISVRPAYLSVRSIPRPVVHVVVGVFAAVFYALLSVSRFTGFQSGVDLTIFGQATRQYAMLAEPLVRVKSQAPFNILGDHFSPVLAAVAPFYAVWSDVRLLLLAQAVLLGVGVVIVGRFAGRHLEPNLALIVQIAFAVSWGILGAARFDFHEVAFGVPLLALALVGAIERRDGLLIGAAGLLLLVKEDASLFVVGLGLFLMWQRRWRLGASLTCSGVVWLVLTTQVLIPHFSYYGRYSYTSSQLPQGSGLLQGLMSASVTNLASGGFWVFLIAMALVAGPGIISPVMLVALPTIALRLVSTNPVYFRTDLHYGALLMVVASLALVEVLKLPRPGRPLGYLRPPGWLIGLALAGAVFSISTNGVLSQPIQTIACQGCSAARAVVAAVPDGATVAAGPSLGPHLVDRAEVSLANETWTDSTGVALDVDWVILDIAEVGGWQEKRVAELRSDGFVTYRRAGSYLLLTRL